VEYKESFILQSEEKNAQGNKITTNEYMCVVMEYCTGDLYAKLQQQRQTTKFLTEKVFIIMNLTILCSKF
jgi:hypothetical protein